MTRRSQTTCQVVNRKFNQNKKPTRYKSVFCGDPTGTRLEPMDGGIERVGAVSGSGCGRGLTNREGLRYSTSSFNSFQIG